jgi:hypothetical protein
MYIYIYYMHKVLRGQPRQRGREVNINEVSDEVNNEDLRYQWGDVMNIVAKNWKWTDMGSPLKPVARGCVSTHANCKEHFLARDKCFFWFFRLSSHGEGAKTFGSRHLRGYFLAVGETNFSLLEKLFFLGLFWLERSCSHACGREEEVV